MVDDSYQVWEKFFAWRPVPTPGYLDDWSWLETVLRRRNPETGEWEYKKTYSREDENDLLVERQTAP